MRKQIIGAAFCIACLAASAAAQSGCDGGDCSEPLTATITVSGSEQQPSGVWDTNPITISFNGFTETVSPGQFSTSASIASAFAGKFARDYASVGLSAQVICGTNSSLITFSLATGTFGVVSVTGSTTSFHMTPSGFAQITDSGTITLTVNGTLAATTTYGAGATINTVAAGLAAGVTSSSPVNVTASGSALSLQSKTAGAATDYSYSVQTTSYDSTDFAQPSFVNPPLTGSLTGGANATSGASATVYSYSITNSSGASGYDGVDNVTNYTDSVMGTWAFGYDTLNRLTSGSGTPPISTPTSYYCWGYDSFGNRLTQSESNQAFQTGTSTPCQAQTSASIATDTATYSTANQMVSTNASGVLAYPSIDGAGEIYNDGVNAYAYDADGRICAVETHPQSGGVSLVQYLYNAEGQRVAKGTIQFVTVNGQSTLSCDTTVNQFVLTNQYLLGPSGEQETELNASGIVVHTNVYASGSLLATFDNTGGLHYHLNDWLGTVRVQTTAVGAMEQTWFSLPFGDGLTPSTLGSTEQHYTGKERDAESGLDYFGARYYASTMGRFMSPDWAAKAEPVPYSKLDDPQTLNLYSYVRNNPLGGVDPDGHYFVVSAAMQQQVQQYISTLLRTPQGAATVNAIASSNLPVSFGLGTLPAVNNGNGTMSITAGQTVPVPGSTPGAIGGASVTLDNSNISTIASATGKSDFQTGLTAFTHEDQHVTDILSATTFQGAAAAGAAGDAPSQPGANNTTGGTAESRAQQIVGALGGAGQSFQPNAQYDGAAATILQQGAAQQQAAQQKAACSGSGGSCPQ
jgi:RHS repeat-associated protein